MCETSIKAMLEFIIPRLVRMLQEKQSLEVMAFERSDTI